MLTLFSVPKAFQGRIGEIQRAALASWTALGGTVQVIVLGDEEGVAEAARVAGAEYVPLLARTEHGTPRLDSAFAEADRVARHALRCFVNADVLLFDDVLAASGAVARQAPPCFLVIGRTLDVDRPLARDEA